MSPLAGLLAAASLASARAPAEASPAVAVDLEWRAPQGCPDASDVEATIDQLVGQPLAHSGASASTSARVRALVRPQHEGFVVELSTQHGAAEEHRTFAAPRCEVLADATALIVAVALRPLEAAAASSVPASSTPASSAPASSAIPASSATPAPARSVAPEPRPEPPPRSPSATADPSHHPPSDAPPAAAARATTLGGALTAALGPGVGVLPGVAMHLTAALALRGRRWRAEAGGTYWLARPASTSDEPTVEIGLSSGLLRGCYVAGRSRLELPVCAGAELGVMRGRGMGPGVRGTTSRSPWAATHVGSGVTLRLRAWAAVRLSVDAIVALRRPGFDLRLAGERVELHRAPLVGGRAALGIELRWP